MVELFNTFYCSGECRGFKQVALDELHIEPIKRTAVFASHDHDPDPVAVFFFKKRHGTAFKCLIRRHFFYGHGNIVPDPVIHQGFNLIERIQIHL